MTRPPVLTRWAVLLLLAWGMAFAAQPLFRALVFDLRSVRVEPMVEATPGRVTVDRIVRRDVRLRWSITIRDMDTGSAVCTPSQKVPFPYTRAANAVNPHTQSLLWWIGGATAMADCISSGFGPGLYRVETCHYWHLGWHACRDSNVFAVMAHE